MAQTTSYYLYQKYEKRGDQEWIPVYPNVFSVDGDGTMPLSAKTVDDPACGYVPTGQTQYRWVNIPITTDYVCDYCPEYRTTSGTPYCVGTDKYVDVYSQVSYDEGSTWETTATTSTLVEAQSPDCGYSPIQYRWVNLDPSTDYYCSGTTKYYKQQKQQSTDGGTTWSNVVPAEYQWGSSAQSKSTDCGYVPSYSGQYLTLKANSTAGTIILNTSNTFYYSTDNGSTWTSATSADTIPLTTGGTMFKGTMTPLLSPYYGIGTFSADTQFTAEGNAMSLLYSNNFSGQTSLSGKDYAFRGLFSGCTGLTSAETLVLPATTLSLQCYRDMFRSCTSLTAAPELPATTLGNHCYVSMFYGCSSLTTAPVLSATTLTNNCYARMFSGCTNLNYIKCLATDISADFCTSNWVNSVASTGTFVKASSMTGWPTGVSGIPDNWTVQNA